MGGPAAIDETFDFEVLPLADDPGRYMVLYGDGSYLIARPEACAELARRVSEAGW